MSSPSNATDRAPELHTTRWFNTAKPLALDDLRFYVLMCVLGTALPYGALVAWEVESGGFNVAAMLGEIAGSRPSLLAWADVLVAAVVLIYFILREGRRLSISGVWMPVAGTCVVASHSVYPYSC